MSERLLNRILEAVPGSGGWRNPQGYAGVHITYNTDQVQWGRGPYFMKYAKGMKGDRVAWGYAVGDSILTCCRQALQDLGLPAD